MTRKVLEGRNVLTNRPTRVVVQDGIIDAVELLHDTREALPWISSALIDLQVNGFGGIDLNDASLTSHQVKEMAHRLKSEGTGYWIPTIVTQSREHISHLLSVLKAACQDPEVAQIISCAHLEGPSISPNDGPRGAHDREFVRGVDLDEVAHWQSIFPIGYMTISPHWGDTPQKVGELRKMGIHVAIGHTDASTEEVAAASVAGATMSTHLGNGCPAELPRHPNFLWEQIADTTLDAGLIADGHHLPVTVLETIIRAKGIDHCFLVSDSVSLAGSPPGRYTTPVGGEVVLDCSRRLALAHDTRLLAGSAVSLSDCLRFLASSSTLSTAEIFTMATRVPGRILGEVSRTQPRGVITPGTAAEIVIWDDALKPIEVWTSLTA